MWLKKRSEIGNWRRQRRERGFMTVGKGPRDRGAKEKKAKGGKRLVRMWLSLCVIIV